MPNAPTDFDMAVYSNHALTHAKEPYPVRIHPQHTNGETRVHGVQFA